MKKLVLKILVNTLAIYIASLIFHSITIENPGAVFAAGITLAVVNIVIRPILILLTFPVNLLSLGLFTLVVNTWMIMLTDFLVGGLDIPGFWLSLIVALIVSFCNISLNHFLEHH